MKKSNQDLQHVPATKVPELPTTSGNTSPPNAGTKNIHSNSPRTYFEFDPGIRSRHPDITKGYEYLGESEGAFCFKIALDIQDQGTNKKNRREGFLLAPVSGSDKAVFVYSLDANHRALNAVNIRYKDLPITLRREIVARQASGPVCTLKALLFLAIYEGADSVLGLQYLYAESALEMAENGEFYLLEHGIKTLLRDVRGCGDDDFLSGDGVMDTIADLEKILAMAKAVSLYPAN